MTKDDLKKYLLEQGASETLLRMPAVMERIYSYFEIDIYSPFILYCGKTNKQMTLGTLTPNGIKRMISIGENGSIIIKNNNETRSFEERPNGEAIYVNHDSISESSDYVGEYLIDKYGMDVSYNDGDTDDIHRNDNGTLAISGRDYRDDGSPILNIEFYFLRQRNGRYTWDKYKEYLTANYPITEEWFEKKEEEKLQNVSEQDIGGDGQDRAKIQEELDTVKGENEQLKTENSRLESENEELKATQEQLQKENEQAKAQVETSTQQIQALQKESEEKTNLIKKLQAMLKQALEICEKVNKNWLLRVLAGIKKNNIPNALPEPEITQIEQPKLNNNKPEGEIIQPEEMGKQSSMLEQQMPDQQPPMMGTEMPESPSPMMGAVKPEPPSPMMGAVKPESPSPMMGAVKPEPPSPMMGAVKPEPPSPMMGAVKPEPPSPMMGAQMPNQQPQQWQQGQMQGQQPSMMGTTMSGPQIPEQ